MLLCVPLTTMGDSFVSINIENKKETQHGSEGGVNKREEGLGGYMAIYHDIEEMCYGPESGMPEIMRVFLCIRHKLLRDGLCEKKITYKFISEKTGMEKRHIIPCAKKLQKMGYIIITQNKEDLGKGKFRYYDNSYSLNPEKFGELYNWYKNNPTVRVYEGSKARSYSAKGVVPDQRPGVLPNEGLGVVPSRGLGKSPKFSELLDNLSSNNPSLITHINNPFQKMGELNSQVSGSGSVQLSDPQAEARRQLAEARAAGVL